MRIGGLASGMDTDTVVKQLMEARRVPLDKLNQQKQLTEWRREDYRNVSVSFISLNEKLSNFSLSQSIDSKKAAVSGAQVLEATPTAAASNSVMNMVVNSLATATNVQTTNGIGAKDLSTKISSLYSGSQNSIAIGSTTIAIDSEETIGSLINKINSSKAGVTAIYDEALGKMSLNNNETGAKDITLSGEILTQTFDLNTKKVGDNASVTINGLVTTQPSNQFTINGVQISLTGVTPTGQSTQIQVTQDVDKVVDTVKSFVEAYNAQLDMLNKKTGEERYRKFLPLSAEQKKEMSEDEVKLWEEKAKSGLLRRDTILEKAATDMRAALISDVTLADGSKINITEIGITTGKYGERGKLIINEERLREAIQSNPEGVYALLGQTDSSTKDVSNQDGIFNRLKKINNAGLTALADKAGTSKFSKDITTAFTPESQMGEELRRLNSRIADVTSMLTQVENRYYKQFAAMEAAINKYNSISSSLFV